MSSTGERTIMIIGAGREHIIAQDVARSLGLRTFVTDGNPDAPGLKAADYSAVVSTYDHEATLTIAREHIQSGGTISGVMTIASDVPFTVAYVADGLGLPGLSLEAARNVSEKMLMKERFFEAGVPIPLFREVSGKDDIIAFSRETGFPLIIKPVDSRGARGVQLVSSEMELHCVYETAKKESPSGRVMAEEYLEGPQLSVEGAMVDGQACLPAIFDRNYEYLENYAPFIIENGGEMPSRYSEQYKAESEFIMTQAGKALGITNGVVKGDFVIHNGVIKVIEVAGRLSGGFFGTVATPYSTGVNPVANVIRMAIGEKVSGNDWMANVERGACIRFSFPQPGVVDDFIGLDTVKRDRACLYSDIYAMKGDVIGQISSHPDRPAVIVAAGSDRVESVRNAERLIRQIEIKIN